MSMIVDWEDLPKTPKTKTKIQKRNQVGFQITDGYSEDEWLLHCPACGEEYLHHTQVETFVRQEDEKEGIHTTTDFTDASQANSIKGRVSVDRIMVGNPSCRREGLVITFYCEMCSHISKLKIFQHKGQTFIRHDVAKKIKGKEKGKEGSA